ncbi:hypothetical protein FNV43_RR20625 [Rhamnella rubrinervis]|uniref:Uncharacterized protein n=1 Tax=Rhamnella rubrinervis TaxID=2594499 RepID=A0A8K0E1I0_9ROSA|nr:hypothetical protein FNV43_RR20625 [Rhamnella rubrinervis]
MTPISPADPESKLLTTCRTVPKHGFRRIWSILAECRKLCTSKLLSASKTETFAALRKEEIVSLVESLKKSAMAGEAVDLSRQIGEAVEDIAKTMILGRIKDDRYDLYLKGLVQEMLNLVGAFNVADYVPVLGALDIQGLSRRLKSQQAYRSNTREDHRRA